MGLTDGLMGNEGCHARLVWSPLLSVSGLAENFEFSVIGLTSGHRKWVLAHSIRG